MDGPARRMLQCRKAPPAAAAALLPSSAGSDARAEAFRSLKVDDLWLRFQRMRHTAERNNSHLAHGPRWRPRPSTCSAFSFARPHACRVP